jgi:2,4-dienoyl-CoA reductase-like NADH-dependent reductase (Old Yellow Enzyme family)
MDQLSKAFLKRKLNSMDLKNCFIKTATYEGMYDQGIPNQDLIDHHVAMANGGVALTTVAYGAVSRGGRTFKDQMYIHDQSLEKLKILAEKVHEAGGKVSMQLTHCGYFSKNTESKIPLAPSRIFNAYGLLSGIPFSKSMTGTDLNHVAEDFKNSAQLLKAIGFDAIEIHMGHGYLLSQFLSPCTNRRKDEYGGSIDNRCRFPLEVYESVRSAVGKHYPILVKLNLSDGFEGGFSLEDCKYMAIKLEQLGCDAIILSGGFTSKTPFYLMRGDVPLKGMIKNGDSLAEKITMALFGPFLVKKYKFESNFFLKQALEIRKATDVPLAYLGGVDSRDDIEEIIKAGFNFIALGRPLIHDSEFLLKIQTGQIEKSGCNRCNECVVEMDRGGVNCVLEQDNQVPE